MGCCCTIFEVLPWAVDDSLTDSNFWTRVTQPYTTHFSRSLFPNQSRCFDTLFQSLWVQSMSQIKGPARSLQTKCGEYGGEILLGVYQFHKPLFIGDGDYGVVFTALHTPLIFWHEWNQMNLDVRRQTIINPHYFVFLLGKKPIPSFILIGITLWQTNIAIEPCHLVRWFTYILTNGDLP